VAKLKIDQSSIKFDMSQTRQHPYRRIRAFTYKGLAYEGYPTPAQTQAIQKDVDRLNKIKVELKSKNISNYHFHDSTDVAVEKAILRNTRVECDKIFDKWIYTEGIDYKQQYGFTLMRHYCEVRDQILRLLDLLDT